ncbi:hypothetical protein L6R50_22900 [Myxococcota bacterium]|nr:hypothetical protein [Myxococcota bacterium]
MRGLRILIAGCSLLASCSDFGLGPSGGAGDPGGGASDGPTDGAAMIQVLPDPFDFGTTATACRTGEVAFTIRNVGDAPLEISGVSLSGASADVTSVLPTVPATLDPDELLEGTLWWAPQADGAPSGVLTVRSDDPLAPEIARPLAGASCRDSDGDGDCDDVDADRDGDGIANDADAFPDHIVLDDAHVGFDEFVPGTRILDQYAGLGIHFTGAGSAGQGYDTNVVQLGPTCTQAVLDSPDNVLCTYVNDGFNFDGEPGLAGWLDQEADAVTVRMYTAGMAYAETNGHDQDQATLVTYDASGAEIGRHTARADTSTGLDYVDLLVLGPGASSFALYTGDFDAADDLHVLRLAAPECEE